MSMDFVTSDFAMSLTGESHKIEGTVCQDYSATRKIKAQGNKHFVISAVADGVGACEKADEGAALAVTTALNYLEKYLTKEPDFQGEIKSDTLYQMFGACYRAINEHSIREKTPMMEYSTTLTVVAYDIDNYTLYFAHIGDGGIVALDVFGNLQNPTVRTKIPGEPVNFVRTIEDVKCWTFGKADDIAAYAIMTDGLYDVVSPIFKETQGYHHRNFIPFFVDLFYSKGSLVGGADEIKQRWITFFNSKSFRSQVSDDISLVSYVNPKVIKAVPSIPYDKAAIEKEEKIKSEALKKALYPGLYY